MGPPGSLPILLFRLGHTQVMPPSLRKRIILLATLMFLAGAATLAALIVRSFLIEGYTEPSNKPTYSAKYNQQPINVVMRDAASLPASCDFVLNKMQRLMRDQTIRFATLTTDSAPNLDEISRAGVFIFVREKQYAVLVGTKDQLGALENLGFAFREPLERDYVKRPIKVSLNKPADALFVSQVVSDTWPEGKCENSEYCVGRAFDLEVQCLQEKGFKVQVCGTASCDASTPQNELLTL